VLLLVAWANADYLLWIAWGSEMQEWAAPWAAPMPAKTFWILDRFRSIALQIHSLMPI
jgi:hypothetical protein